MKDRSLSALRGHFLPRAKGRRALIDLACCLLLALLCVVAQRRSLAYRSDFSLDPDEPAHAVSSLMVHDYLAHRSPGNPVSFARMYYDHYPKVAIGHWPPLFYVCEGVWTAVFGRSRAVLLSFIAVSGIGLVCSVYLQLRSRLSSPLALFAAFLLLFSTSFEQMLSAVRPDLLLALIVFWAALAAGRWMFSRSRHALILYLALTLAACLVHGRGALLLLLPFVLLPLARRSVTWRWVLAAMFLVPLFLLPPSFHQGYPPTARTTIAELRNFAFYALTPLHLLALGCLVYGAVAAWRDREARAFWASMAALAVSGGLFLLLVPAGWENHYLIAILAPAACLVAAGIQSVRQSVVLTRIADVFWLNAVVLLALLAIGARGLAHVPVKPDTGARALAASGLFREHKVALVAGRPRDEGALIAQAALDDPAVARTVLRASKSLAIVNWSGDGYHQRFASDSQVAAFLNQRGVSLVVIRSAAGERPDIARLRSVVTAGGDWKRSVEGEDEVYSR